MEEAESESVLESVNINLHLVAGFGVIKTLRSGPNFLAISAEDFQKIKDKFSCFASRASRIDFPLGVYKIRFNDYENLRELNDMGLTLKSIGSHDLIPKMGSIKFYNLEVYIDGEEDSTPHSDKIKKRVVKELKEKNSRIPVDVTIEKLNTEEKKPSVGFTPPRGVFEGLLERLEKGPGRARTNPSAPATGEIQHVVQGAPADNVGEADPLLRRRGGKRKSKKIRKSKKRRPTKKRRPIKRRRLTKRRR